MEFHILEEDLGQFFAPIMLMSAFISIFGSSNSNERQLLKQIFVEFASNQIKQIFLVPNLFQLSHVLPNVFLK